MKDAEGLQNTALSITRAVGSPASIALHTILFLLSFGAAYLGYIPFDRMLLVLTTIVSLEAIYLSIFIQMTINYTTESIEAVSEDIEEIQEDVGEIQEDVDEIQKDVDELQEDVDEIQEDVEEMNEEETAEEKLHAAHDVALSDIQRDLRKLLEDVDRLKKTERT